MALVVHALATHGEHRMETSGRNVGWSTSGGAASRMNLLRRVSRRLLAFQACDEGVDNSIDIARRHCRKQRQAEAASVVAVGAG